MITATPDHVLNELKRQSILAMGRTWPNPAVACVIEVEDAGLFCGATEKPGFRHAEIVALDALDKKLADVRQGKIYVTLEPCSRTGRTPPCVDRILKYPGLKVVIGSTDVTLSGEGIERLRRSSQFFGMDESIANIADAFLRGFQNTRIHFKAAESNGFMGSKSKRVMLSGPESQSLAMMLRAKLDAVVVGPGTVRVDQPSLDLRDPGVTPNIRGIGGSDIFLDSLLANWEDVSTLAMAESTFQPARVFILGRRFERDQEFIEKQLSLSKKTGRDAIFATLHEQKANWRDLPDSVRVDLPQLSHPDFNIEFRSFLKSRGMNEVLIEGGAGFFSSVAPAAGDRSILFRSQNVISGLDVKLPEFLLKGAPQATYQSGNDIIEVRAFK